MRVLGADKSLEVDLLPSVDALHQALDGFPRRVRVRGLQGSPTGDRVQPLDLALQFGPLLLDPLDDIRIEGRHRSHPIREPRLKVRPRVAIINKVDADFQPMLWTISMTSPSLGRRRLWKKIHGHHTMIAGRECRDVRARQVLKSLCRRIDPIQTSAPMMREEREALVPQMAGPEGIGHMFA